MPQYPQEFTDEDLKDYEIIEKLTRLYDECAEHAGSFDIFKIFELACSFKKELVYNLGEKLYHDFKNSTKDKNQ